MKLLRAVEALAALAQETRLALFRLLVRQGPLGLAAGDIGEKLRVPAATLSFHLSQLSRAGLLVSRREGRSIIYAADYDGMAGLMAYLTENCCQGSAESCAPECGPPDAVRPEARPRRRRGVS